MAIKICSTRPVHEPQLALVFGVLAHFVQREQPFSLMALQMVPLVTPLQPQTSASSGIWAALFWLRAAVADVDSRRTSACRAGR